MYVPNPELDVRPAGPFDAASIAHVQLVADPVLLADAFPSNSPEQLERAERLRAVWSTRLAQPPAGETTLVAEQEGYVVGYLTLSAAGMRELHVLPHLADDGIETALRTYVHDRIEAT